MKKCFIIAVAAILLFACDDTTGESLSVRSLETIRLTAKVPSGSGTTRACSEDNLQGTQFVAGKEIFVEAYKTGQNTAYTLGIYTTGNAGALTGNLYYPADNSNVDLCAYYPGSITSASTTFAVSSNQSSEANYQASDLMYATKLTNKSSNTTHNLTFNHALTKIVVNIVAGDGLTTSNITTSPGVTAVKINNTLLNAQLAISGGVITASRAATGSAADITITGTGQSNIGIIVPQTVPAGDFITVIYNNLTYTYSLAEAKTFLGGKVYTYTLTLMKASGQLVTSVDVEDWDTEVIVDVDVIKPGFGGDLTDFEPETEVDIDVTEPRFGVDVSDYDPEAIVDVDLSE